MFTTSTTPGDPTFLDSRHLGSGRAEARASVSLISLRRTSRSVKGRI